MANLDLKYDARFGGDGSFQTESSQPFGIMVYGYSSFTSYLFPGGLDLNIINSGI